MVLVPESSDAITHPPLSFPVIKRKNSPKTHNRKTRIYRVPDEQDPAVHEAPLGHGGAVHHGPLEDGTSGGGGDEGQDLGEVLVLLLLFWGFLRGGMKEVFQGRGLVVYMCSVKGPVIASNPRCRWTCAYMHTSDKLCADA